MMKKCFEESAVFSSNYLNDLKSYFFQKYIFRFWDEGGINAALVFSSKAGIQLLKLLSFYINLSQLSQHGPNVGMSGSLNYFNETFRPITDKLPYKNIITLVNLPTY